MKNHKKIQSPKLIRFIVVIVLSTLLFNACIKGNEKKKENKKQTETDIKYIALFFYVRNLSCGNANAIDVGFGIDDYFSPCTDNKIQTGAIYDANTKQPISGETINTGMKLECRCPGTLSETIPHGSSVNSYRPSPLRWFLSDKEPAPNGYKVKEVYQHTFTLTADPSQNDKQLIYTTDSYSTYSNGDNLYCVFKCLTNFRNIGSSTGTYDQLIGYQKILSR